MGSGIVEEDTAAIGMEDLPGGVDDMGEHGGEVEGAGQLASDLENALHRLRGGGLLLLPSAHGLLPPPASHKTSREWQPAPTGTVASLPARATASGGSSTPPRALLAPLRDVLSTSWRSLVGGRPCDLLWALAYDKQRGGMVIDRRKGEERL